MIHSWDHRQSNSHPKKALIRGHAHASLVGMTLAWHTLHRTPPHLAACRSPPLPLRCRCRVWVWKVRLRTSLVETTVPRCSAHDSAADFARGGMVAPLPGSAPHRG